MDNKTWQEESLDLRDEIFVAMEEGDEELVWELRKQLDELYEECAQE